MHQFRFWPLHSEAVAEDGAEHQERRNAAMPSLRLLLELESPGLLKFPWAVVNDERCVLDTHSGGTYLRTITKACQQSGWRTSTPVRGGAGNALSTRWVASAVLSLRD